MLYMLALRVSDKFLLLTYNLQNLVFVSPNDLFSSALRNSIPFNHDRSCKHEQPKEGGKGPLDCEYFRKKVVFFVSSGKKQILPLLPPPTYKNYWKNPLVPHPWKKSFRRPCL